MKSFSSDLMSGSREAIILTTRFDPRSGTSAMEHVELARALCQSVTHPISNTIDKFPKGGPCVWSMFISCRYQLRDVPWRRRDYA